MKSITETLRTRRARPYFELCMVARIKKGFVSPRDRWAMANQVFLILFAFLVPYSIIYLLSWNGPIFKQHTFDSNHSFVKFHFLILSYLHEYDARLFFGWTQMFWDRNLHEKRVVSVDHILVPLLFFTLVLCHIDWLLLILYCLQFIYYFQRPFSNPWGFGVLGKFFSLSL